MLQVFTWNFWKTVVWLLAFVRTEWNLLTFFIWKKIANELPIRTQCKFNTCYQKMPKTSFPWYENLILSPVFHFRVRDVFTNLLSVYRSNAWKCIKLIAIVQSACLKGSYSSDNVDLDPLFIWNDAISFSSDWFYWKLSQIMPKKIAFNNNTPVLFRYVKLCRKIKTALPVYFILPLSIFTRSSSRNCQIPFFIERGFVAVQTT